MYSFLITHSNAPARDQTSWAVGPGAAAAAAGAGAADSSVADDDALEDEEKKPPRAGAGAGAGVTTGRGGAKGLRPCASSSCSRLESPWAPNAPGWGG